MQVCESYQFKPTDNVVYDECQQPTHGFAVVYENVR